VRLVLVFLAVAALLATPAGAATTPPGPYRTDAQAARYVLHGLRHWAGINLNAGKSVTTASCINGYFSATERGTGKHFNGGKYRVNLSGQLTYRSFACTLYARGREFHLYLVTLAKRPFWKVAPDR
jgi:hypothetical protein